MSLDSFYIAVLLIYTYYITLHYVIFHDLSSILYSAFLFLLYRKHYHLSVPQSWEDLEKTHPKVVVDQLKTVYTSVKDIELYIAGTFCHLIGQ